MKLKLKGIQHEFLSTNNAVALVYDKSQTREVSDWLQTINIDDGKEYEVEIKKHRKKRSLNANNYSWVLTGKLADALNMDKEKCHALMLARYGQSLRDENGQAIVISVKAEVPEDELIKNLGYVAAIPTHGWVDGQEFIHYRVLKGSSTFNSREMSIFIDGIVGECKEQGIETLTPDELARMKQQWGAE